MLGIIILMWLWLRMCGCGWCRDEDESDEWDPDAEDDAGEEEYMAPRSTGRARRGRCHPAALAVATTTRETVGNSDGRNDAPNRDGNGTGKNSDASFYNKESVFRTRSLIVVEDSEIGVMALIKHVYINSNENNQDRTVLQLWNQAALEVQRKFRMISLLRSQRYARQYYSYCVLHIGIV